jgi:hypothetical protein
MLVNIVILFDGFSFSSRIRYSGKSRGAGAVEGLLSASETAISCAKGSQAATLFVIQIN